MAPRSGDRRGEYTRITERVLDKIMTCTQMLLPYGIKHELEWQYYVEINDLAVELIQVQAKAGAEFGPKISGNKSKAPIADQLNKLKKWLQTNGVAKDIPIDFIANTNQGIGVVATRDIKPNEEVIRIPRTLCMSTNSASRSSILRELIASTRGLNGFSVMVLHIMAEKVNPASFWKPYLDMLPETHPLPIYFNPTDMIEIKDTTLVRDLASSLRDLLRAYASIFRTVEKTKVISLWNFTFSEFRWAAATLFTRQNLIPGYCQSDIEALQGSANSSEVMDHSQLPQRVLALIPGWDMINHKEGLPITSTNNYDDGDQVFVAPEMVKAGNQVYMGYTEERANRTRFLRTGFVAQNPLESDTLHVSFKFPNLKDVARRKGVANKLFHLTEPFPLDIAIPLGKNHDNIIGTLACAFGTEEDLEMLEGLEPLPTGEGVTREKMLPIVERNAAAVLKAYEEGKLKCTSKILRYIETQAMVQMSRNEEIVSEVKAKLAQVNKELKEAGSIDTKKWAGLQFRKNVLEYYLVERAYGERVIEYAQKEMKMIS